MASTSSGFCSPKSDCFPAGLRVLLVDDDPKWLKTLEKMLTKCNYAVTTCYLAQKALDTLQERKDGFDMVICDMNMPDMDGFTFLEHVCLKMDIPVIMTSADGETSRVMKGVQLGACDYLLKPIKMKEIQNIWQHVFRKRMHEAKGIAGQNRLDGIQIMGNGMEESNDGHLFSGDMMSGKKRKEFDNKNNEIECGESSSTKKARVVWTGDLHQKFVKAVNRIEFEKVGPKKILDLMGVPWLTRENVASHLQKYRLYLSRLQKENELKAASGGIKLLDISSNDPSGNVCIQSAVRHNSFTVQQNIVINENCAVPGHNIQIHNHGANICEGNENGILTMPMAAEHKKTLLCDLTDSSISNTSRIDFNESFELMMNSQGKAESKMQAHCNSSAAVPSFQFKPHFESDHTFDPFPLPVPPCIQVDFVSHNSIPLSSETDKPTEANISASYSNNRSYAIGTENTAALLSVQPQRHLTNSHIFDEVPCSMWSQKNNSLEENLSLKNIIVGTGSALRLCDVESNGYTSPGDLYPLNSHFVNLESRGFGNEELVAGVRSHLYDLESFDNAYPSDDLVVNEGLYLT